LAQCIKKWQAHGQFTHFQGRKFALLLNTAEYFSGTNFKDKDFLLGAASLDENDRYFVIGYAPAGVDGRSAYVDVVRAANQMKEDSSSYMAQDASMGKYDSTQVASGGAGPSSSDLSPEVQEFIGWIKNKEGLASYIQYYLDQNDPGVITKLAKAYNDFRQVFGF